MRSFKLSLLLYFSFSFVISQVAFATPASDVKLDYNLEDHILSVSAYHVSHDLNKEYIRKVVITVNEEEPVATYFRRQNRHDMFEGDFNIEAKPGDNINVELYSSQGGVNSESMKVPEQKQDEEKKENE